jgi:TrmH family RNA methyltransferase
MGAHFFLSIFEAVDLAEVAHGFPGRIVAMEPRAQPSLFELDLKGPVAWIFGNEGAGLSESVLRLATHRACIPMPGSAESLNVAAAAAICLFEQLRQNARL